jgi:hypothetical protein
MHISPVIPQMQYYPFPTLCNKMSLLQCLQNMSSQDIVGGAPMNAALLNPSSCLIVPLSNGQSLDIHVKLARISFPESLGDGI